ncbi:HpcH/HpaI aldolase/citrate lyase family protein [Nocardia callitridis]|uniref:CoA ester lyase n=1 Tax=Nocardia callitridis TaxID=648753 RepID=A0ABP9KM80_9NOCA
MHVVNRALTGSNGSAIARRVAAARTLLFVPGSRPDRFDKAVASGADAVILDLEDAVATADKVTARHAVADWLGDGNAAVVRVNAPDSAYWAEDVEAICGADAVIMVPKAEDVDQVRALAAEVAVIALIETSRGVLGAERVCAVPGVIRAALGHIDLAAELGVDPDDRTAFAMARSTLVLASAAAGLAPPLDGVTTDLSAEDVLSSDVRHAKSLGFGGKLCIHPSQVAVAAATLRPSAVEVAWAESVVAALPSGGGAAQVNGRMVDPPVLARARRILAVG